MSWQSHIKQLDDELLSEVKYDMVTQCKPLTNQKYLFYLLKNRDEYL